MLAVVQKQVDDTYVAVFERKLQYSVDKVWFYLTENDRLVRWFPELRVGDLKEGGAIQFHFQDGTFDELQITELKTCSVLEFTWWGDGVRFELHEDREGCVLVLKRTLQSLTDHTAKDLTGWHVCLNVIHALLDGRTIESREHEWKEWYQKYVHAVEEKRVG